MNRWEPAITSPVHVHFVQSGSDHTLDVPIEMTIKFDSCASANTLSWSQARTILVLHGIMGVKVPAGS